jgi:hypothetical protein
MTNSKAIIVGKGGTTYQPVPDMRIEITGKLDASPAVRWCICQDDAKAIEEALYHHLPAMTYDELAALMLRRKASQLSISHQRTPAEAARDALFEATIRSQGVYDVSERRAVNMLEAVIARVRGLEAPIEDIADAEDVADTEGAED